ncbi:uncharacterized protein [Atheta coriaria]|uniref:uncharacterized protein isoform X2 n=1 Tax=Dalotia coriaria TaxID=877792 RepID=UPI0031F42341
MRKLLDERRNIYKEFHAFVSTSESEEDMPHGEEHAKRRLSETGTSQNSPSQHSSDNPSKKKPVKYIIISEGDSTPSKHLNPVLNSDTPNELVLTQVLHDNPEDIPNPDSPPNFLMPSMDVDIFSMFSEPQNKPPFNEPVVAQEAEEEQLGEDSDSVPEAGTTEMQIDLGGVMNISQTMPTDFLEPSDNECMGLQRMKRDISHKSADSFLPFCNNNVKIEESDVGTMEVEVNSEYGNEVNTEASDGVVDYIGWKDSILVIKIVKDLIVAGNDKGKLFLFDTKSAFPIFTETICLNEAITAMDVYENGSNTRLFIGSQNQNLYVYDIGDRRLLRVISVGTPIQCLELMWMSLFIGSSKGELIRFSLANGRITAPEKISESAVLAIKGSMDGSRRVLVVALRNAPISIRDASSCLELRTIGEDLYSVYSIVLFHNRVYCGTSHDDVLVYNFHDGQLLLKHGESRGSGIVNMIIVRNVLFVACYNGKICIYNTTDNSFITSMTAPSGLLLSMAIVNKKLIAGTKQNFQCMPLPESVASLL